MQENKIVGFALFLLLAQCNLLFAQQQIEPIKKAVAGENGAYYQQLSLPVYFFMATNPEGTDRMLIPSETTKEHANPMHFDGHGTHALRHIDAIENVEVTFKMWADGLAPVSKIDFAADHQFFNGKQLCLGANASVKIKSSDDMAGVEQIYLSFNEEDFKVYHDQVSLPEKELLIKYYAVDKVGNMEEAKSTKVMVDLSAPNTIHTVTGDQNEMTFNTNVVLQLNAEDELSGVDKIFYAFDKEEFKRYYKPLKLSALKEGEHTFSYYAIDKLNNKEELKSFTFAIDKSVTSLK